MNDFHDSYYPASAPRDVYDFEDEYEEAENEPIVTAAVTITGESERAYRVEVNSHNGVPDGWYPKSKCSLVRNILNPGTGMLEVPQWLVERKQTGRPGVEGLFHRKQSNKPKSKSKPESNEPKYIMNLQSNPHYILSLVDDTIKTVAAVFAGGGNKTKYVFKTRLNLAVGDKVIADTKNGLSIVEVVEVHTVPTFDIDVEYCWAFQRVDTEGYQTMLARDKEALDILREAKRRTHRQEALLEVEKMIGPDVQRMRKALQGEVVEEEVA